MKMITNEQTLQPVSETVRWVSQPGRDVQANNAKCNDEVGVEDVRNSEREAQEYTQYSGPGN
jgi:hypothetical protein